ncbi:hypothetical protein PSAB6_70127 [Paraburkholderia sabiae]|nr:hypothetical protein PSAB6_70127 [Paraburkholderia sabiae]
MDRASCAVNRPRDRRRNQKDQNRNSGIVVSLLCCVRAVAAALSNCKVDASVYFSLNALISN